MKHWYCLLLAALLFVGNIHSIRADDDAVDDDDYAEAERAHLVVRKSCKDDLVVQGRNVTINFEIQNGGVAAAYDVVVTDSALPDGLQLVDGAQTATFDKIAPGSSKKFSYVVVATKGDLFMPLPSAQVSYKAEADSSEATTGTSSFTGFYVITPVQEIIRHALTVGRYASLGICKTPSDWRNLAIVLGLIGGFLGVNSIVKTVKESSTARKRKQAQEALEKEQ